MKNNNLVRKAQFGMTVDPASAYAYSLFKRKSDGTGKIRPAKVVAEKPKKQSAFQYVNPDYAELAYTLPKFNAVEKAAAPEVEQKQAKKVATARSKPVVTPTVGGEFVDPEGVSLAPLFSSIGLKRAAKPVVEEEATIRQAIPYTGGYGYWPAQQVAQQPIVVTEERPVATKTSPLPATSDPAILAARQAAAAASQSRSGQQVAAIQQFRAPQYAVEKAATPSPSIEAVPMKEETTTTTVVTRPAPKQASKQASKTSPSQEKAAPAPAVESAPVVEAAPVDNSYANLINSLRGDFSAKIAAARKPFDEAVAKFDQEPSMENIPMSKREQIRSIRRNARQDIKAVRGK